MASEGSFNELIHAPMRLRICGLLRPIDRMDFAVLRDTLKVSDPTLSKHLKLLSDAGFVKMKKAASSTRTDSRRITWLSLTPAGERAFDEHLRALQAIGGGFIQSRTHQPS
ncbi:MAG: transcriptional regulator [Propionibacteriaceae bacterium]|nr:transcriptional regulator [Propionibacteriaceae bacterium]